MAKTRKRKRKPVRRKAPKFGDPTIEIVPSPNMKRKPYHHLVGIVPTVLHNSLGHIVEDALLPSYKNGETLLERAVQTCAAMGCSSVFISLPYNYKTFVRNSIGLWMRLATKDAIVGVNAVPIFYVSTSSKENIILSKYILYAAYQAFVLSSRISIWIAPTKYIVVFPEGVVPFTSIHTDSVRSCLATRKNHLLQFESKTYLDNLPLPFSFQPSDWNLAYKRFQSAKGSTNPKDFAIPNIFQDSQIDEHVEIPWFCDITKGWQKYAEALYRISIERGA